MPGMKTVRDSKDLHPNRATADSNADNAAPCHRESRSHGNHPDNIMSATVYASSSRCCLYVLALGDIAPPFTGTFCCYVLPDTTALSLEGAGGPTTEMVWEALVDTGLLALRTTHEGNDDRM